MKKALALILALSLVLGAMSGIAFAAEESVAQIGDTYYTSFESAARDIKQDGSATTIKFLKDIDNAENIDFAYGTGDVIFTADSPVTVRQTKLGTDWAFVDSKQMNIIVDKNVTFDIYDNSSGIYVYYGPSMEIRGTISGGQNWGTLYLFNGEHLVTETGKVDVGRLQLGYNKFSAAGEVRTNYLLVEASEFVADGAVVNASVIYDNNNGGQRWGASDFVVKNGSEVNTNKLTLSYADSSFTIDTSSSLSAASIEGKGTIYIDAAKCDEDDVVNIGGNISNFNGNIEIINDAKGTLKVFVDGEGNFSVKRAAAYIETNGVFAYYETIQDAIDNAKSGDSIKVFSGEYAPFTVTKNVAISAVDPDDKPVIVITEIADGGVKYKAEDVAIYNLAFVIDENATCTGGYYPAALGFHVEDNARRSYLKLEDCDFINNSDLYAIAVMAHIPSYDIEACKFVNFATGISTALDNGKAVDVSVTENTFEEVDEFISAYWGVANNGSVTILENKATDGSTTKINIQDYVKNTVGADATAFGDIDIKDNDAKVVFTNYDEDDYDSDLTGNKYVVYNYTSKTLLDALDAPEGTVYVNYGRDNEESYLVNEDGIFAAADSLKVEFALNSEAEGEKVYDINLVASASDIINRLNSVDLQFELTQVDGTNDFEIIASNKEVAINPVENSKVRYEFHYNGKDNATTDTDTTITIGQVKFTGYGKFIFAVDADATTNAAHATTLADNIVDTFIPDGDTAVISDGELVIDNATTGAVIINIPVRDLTINIAFPNAVKNNAAAYQDMTVTIVGGETDITRNLGADVDEDAAYTITEKLPYNTAYTVTVTGAGYRTARYTVTLNDHKTLNFWNNVMDEEKEVEVGKDSSKTTKNFLAGDIVKDNNINIYDLSAVVSYFASESTTANGYAKYDLNRDGVIDSKDVAYVLVSWNN